MTTTETVTRFQVRQDVNTHSLRGPVFEVWDTETDAQVGTNFTREQAADFAHHFNTQA